MKKNKKRYVCYEMGIEDGNGNPSDVMIINIKNSQKEAEQWLDEYEREFGGTGHGYQIPHNSS